MKTLKDKNGDPVPMEAFDDYEGPPDRPNPLDKSLDEEWEKEFWAEIDHEIAEDEKKPKKTIEERIAALKEPPDDD